MSSRYDNGDRGYDRNERGGGAIRGKGPKFSRLFILGDAEALDSEQSVKGLFSQFGQILDLYIKKDQAGRSKGVVFITFSQASAAAQAIEDLHMTTQGREPLKVQIASERGKETNSVVINPIRIFIIVPKSWDRSDIKDEFKKYGEVEHVSIVMDKASGTPKGLAYVTYYKFKDAATALEDCNEKYGAQWAESKEEMDRRKRDRSEASNFRGEMGDYTSRGGGDYTSRGGGGGGYGDYGQSQNLMNMMSTDDPQNYTHLRVMFNPQVSKESFWQLFNIVPGLLSCDLSGMNNEGAVSQVVYNNPTSAAHALDRINGFEMPPGYPIMICYDGGAPLPRIQHNMPRNIASLMENIKQATDAIKASGWGNLVESVGSGREWSNENSNVDARSVCSANLPDRKEVLPQNTRRAERLFFALKNAQDAPKTSMLIDVFCRFGNLIEVYLIRGKKCGYANYASTASAAACIACLNGEDLLGSRLVVEKAEELDVKRRRID